ncbi:four-helix bundle copper-binding protein [bacterium]|nr:MAG: four-helix bundle copper-binding protein [bacterium]
MHHHMSAEMQQCIENCQKCHATCLSMSVNHCLVVGGAHVAPDHFRLMMDCAQICAVSADFMLRGSKHHPHVCAECADVCEDCAKSCEQLDGMEECVEACRVCVESCKAMAQMIA